MKFSRSIYLILVLAFITARTFTFAQLQQEPNAPAKKTRILFLLDGSGSMLAEWEGTKRIDIAKKMLNDMIDSLATVPNLQLGLRVYGHQYNKQYGNCKDTKLEAPFAPNNHKHIKQKLFDIKPQGVTPIAYSLEKAAYDFPKDQSFRNIIIIITDGLESCNGDPCKVSKALQSRHVYLNPYIIGIGMKESLGKQFSCIGKFKNASTVKSFKAVLSQVVNQSLAKSRIRVDLLDVYGNPKETNVNMTFLNSMTKTPEYDYVHHIGTNGKSDYLKIDPVLTYDIVVNTIPKVIKRNVKISPGDNVIKIQAPQGGLKVSMSGYREYNQVTVLVKDSKNKIIHTMPLNQVDKLLVGNYTLEVLTMPRTIIKKVTIGQSKTTTIQLDSPGRLSIGDNRPGFGSLYKIEDDGRITWIHTFPENSSQTNMAMQPGKYKFVFRDKKSLSSEYTYVKRFDIKQGLTTSLKIFN